jgi:2-polyprenyl-6-hydroxyphenyl methylase/3-demethylubiquinone-9 3-methyltransferase
MKSTACGDALSAVPESEVCGWLKDRYGLPWQITPIPVLDLLGSPEPATAKAAMEAVLAMGKADIAAVEQAAAAA